MAKSMQFDDTRALRREQREARIARKRERREARALKRRHNTMAIEPLALAAPPVRRPETGEPASTGEPAAPAPLATPSAAPTVNIEVSLEPTPAAPDVAVQISPAGRLRRDAEAAQRVPRRKRDVAAFLARREERLRLAREEAKEQIVRLSEDEAVHGALIKLAHSQASPWHQHRERLSEALAGRRIPEIGAAARRACRGAANDAARTSRKAPDPEQAMEVAVAYAVIAQAPWAAIRGPRAERTAPTGQAPARQFRR